MTCLNDTRIQALADGEADAGGAEHAAACAHCGERLRARIAVMSDITRSLDAPVAIPAPLARRVAESFRSQAEGTGSPAEGAAAGATRLRDSRGFPGPRGLRLQAEGRSRWIYSGLAVAAATVLAVLFIVPAVKKGDATVSASEILAKSATQLSAAVSSGVEVLEYELVIDGMPKDALPDQVDGTYRVWQAIDHDNPGHFRFASYASDGTLLTSIAEDPAKKRRVMAFTSEGQPYRFDVSLPANATNMSLPEMQRLHMEASIAMMQANGNQSLDTIDGPNGKLYRIEVPRTTAPGTNPVWDLNEARVLIDARDYRIVEFAVRGTFLKQAYSMSYKLISHTMAAAVPAGAFDVPSQPGEIVIKGGGSTVPTHDVMMLALRELTRLKQIR
jgi:hypothetical protein